MSENPGLFDTPMLRYLSTKKTFLEKFMDSSVWGGEFGSREQVMALDSVLEYLENTSELSNQFPELRNSVLSESKNLIMQHILPLPPKLYEHLLLDVVEEGEGGCQIYWQQQDSITMDKIVKNKLSCCL